MTTTAAEHAPTSTGAPRAFSGRWVVAGMFLFAIALTATLWVYWKLHVGPFLPLQQKLADAFPDSRPRVEGGQRKIHKGSTRILRITMKVDFAPTVREKDAHDFANHVFRFVEGEFDLADYEVFELHLYWPDPEKTIKEITIERDLAGTDDS